MLTGDKAVDIAKQLIEYNSREFSRLRTISNYMSGKHSSVYIPQGTNSEYDWIVNSATYNLVRLVVNVFSQNLYVDGYRRKEEESDAKAWETWQANRFDLFQQGVHRSALTYGSAYAVSLPGELVVAGQTKNVPAFRPVSAPKMVAVYEDDVLDEWPLYAVETSYGFGEKGKTRTIKLYDENFIYTLEGLEDTKLEFQRSVAHNTGFCPVVRYRNVINLDGQNDGEVEPLMKLQDQVNFTTFNLMIAQQFSSFRQRWVTGMAPVLNEDGVEEQPLRSRIDAMLAAESPDTKFGEFSQVDLMGYLKSREETLRGMSIIAQLPPYQFLGTDDLASAEALAAARDGLDRTVNERQGSFGESHEQLLRLSSLQQGDITGWEDVSAQVVWRDTSTRAFAATVDALVKLRQGLDIPAQALWEKVPGVTKSDVERWIKLLEDEPDQFASIMSQLDAQNAAVSDGTSNSAVQPANGPAGQQPGSGNPANSKVS